MSTGNTPGPSQYNDKFSRVVRNNIANMRTLFGRAPVDNRTEGMTMPSDLNPSTPAQQQAIIWAAQDRAEANRVLTPEQVFTRSYGSGAVTLPDRINRGVGEPRPLGGGRTLTPEQRRAAIAGAGSSMSEEDAAGAIEFMSEWYRMSPDQRLSAYTGAGAAASAFEVTDALTDGKVVIAENKDGSSRLVPQGNMVSESDARKARTVGEVSETARWMTNSMLTEKYGLSITSPATDPDTAWQWLSDEFPSVAQAAALAGLSKYDVADVNRVLKVKEVAENAVALYVGNVDGADITARQMIASLPTEEDRTLATTFLADMYSKAMQSASDAEDAGENWWSIGGRILWGVSAGPILNALMLGNEAAVQYATAGVNAFTDAAKMLEDGQYVDSIQTAGVQLAAPVSVLFNGRYDDATRGNMDMEYIESLTNEYVPRAVDAGLSENDARYAVQVAVEVYQATQTHDGEVLDTVLNKYRNDPVAWQIIQQGMYNPGAGSDTWFSDLYTKVSFGDRGNFGSVVTRNLGMDGTWSVSTLTRDSLNIAAMFALDPTLAGGKVVGAVRSARYGMFLLADTTSIAKGFQKSGTQNWFNWYGKEVKAIDELHAAGKHAEAGQRTTTLLSQSKRYANANTLELFRKHKIYTSDQARDFLLGMEAVETIITGRGASIIGKVKPKWGRKGKGNVTLHKPTTATRWADDETARDAFALAASFDAAQAGRRSWQRMTPHQTQAANLAKNVSRVVRSGGDLTRLTARSTPVMDEMLGADFATLSRGQQVERIALIMADDAKVDRLAAELSDFALVVDEFGNVSGARTKVGKLIDKIVKDPKNRGRLGLQRNGWKKKGLDTGEGLLKSIGRAADRLSAHWSRMPDTRGGLITVDASHANKVYAMMRYAGVGRSASSEFRDAWITMSQAEREIAAAGLFRTFAKASGMDLVDKERLGDLLKVGSGASARTTEQYAAMSTERYAGLLNDADAEARVIYKAERAAAKESGDKPRSYVEIRDEQRQIKMAEAAVTDPSARKLENGGTVYGAVWLAQTSDRVAMPNFAAFDNVMARRSFLNSMLFNNKFGSAVVDAWTFGTLMGPRFQLRNGIEDIVMYGITGGKMGAYSEGRRMSTLIRGATGRYDKEMQSLQYQIRDTERKVAELKRNSPASRSLPEQETKLGKFKKELEALEKMGAASQKLGIINKLRMGLVTRAGVGAREGTLRAKFAGALFGRFTTPAERMAAMKEGREAIVALQKRALARDRLLLVKDPEARAIPWRLKRGAEVEDLSPRQQQIMRDMDDFLDSAHGREYEEMAAETSRHLADSTMPVMDDMAPVFKVDDQWYRRTTINQEYVYQRVNGSSATLQQAEGMVFTLNAILSDGPRGQAVVARLERFFNAYNRAGSPDYAEMGRLVDEVVDYLRTTDMWHVYRERFRLNTPEAAQDMVERAFRTATDAFTTPDGKFNRPLWSALDGRVTRIKEGGQFKLVDESGKLVVGPEDFLPGGKFKPAYTVLVRNSDGLDVPLGGLLTGGAMDAGWAAMGRSLARMTREPIYKANYLDARKALRPLEQAYARRFGDDAARKWATDQAAERAYEMTMAYVDNPAVRSVLSYRVRNISRFYRAVEDFGRRMYRTGRNNPMAFWRAALLWNATIDTGYTYTDEYGQEYFMYPLARPGMEALAGIINGLGGGMQIQSMPVGISGQVQWLTPSADPDQWMPTLASPIASIMYRPILRSLPGLTALFGVDDEGNARFTEFGRNVDKAIFGTIGSQNRVNGPFDGYVAELTNQTVSVIPPLFNKILLGAAPLWMGMDAPGSFAAKTALRTALILEASGQGISLEDSKDPVKMREYTRAIERHASAVAVGMALFGLILPASPQMMDDQMTAFGRDLEVTGMRTAFIKLMNNEIENGGDYWSALSKWVERNPDLGIFSLSKKEAAKYGYVDGLEGNAQFAMKYNTLFQEAPDALSMFAPNTGTSTLKARRVLNMFDVRLDKDTEEYAYDLAGRNALVQYWLDKRRLETMIENEPSAERRKWLQNEVWSMTRRRHILNNEGLEAHLMDFEMESTEEFADGVDRMRKVAQAIGTDGNGYGPEFLELYNEWWAPARTHLLGYMDRAEYADEKALVKQAWEAEMKRQMARHPDDEQWIQILTTMTRGLEQAWDLPEG